MGTPNQKTTHSHSLCTPTKCSCVSKDTVKLTSYPHKKGTPLLLMLKFRSNRMITELVFILAGVLQGEPSSSCRENHPPIPGEHPPEHEPAEQEPRGHQSIPVCLKILHREQLNLCVHVFANFFFFFLSCVSCLVPWQACFQSCLCVKVLSSHCTFVFQWWFYNIRAQIKRLLMNDVSV